MSLIKERTNKHSAYVTDGSKLTPLSEMDLAKHKLAFGETKFGMTSGPLVVVNHQKWVSGLGDGFAQRLEEARLEAKRWQGKNSGGVQ